MYSIITINVFYNVIVHQVGRLSIAASVESTDCQSFSPSWGRVPSGVYGQKLDQPSCSVSEERAGLSFFRSQSVGQLYLLTHFSLHIYEFVLLKPFQ